MKRTIATALLAALLSGLPMLAQGQDNTTSTPWYQVEVIIFAQRDDARNEQNLRSITLDYPKPRVFLRSGETVPYESGQLALLSEQDRQLLALMVPAASLQRRDDDQPQPYRTLDKQERTLNPEAHTLGRSGTYQVLFHEAWRQRLSPRNSTPWVVITGGATIGNHRELEGSLRIYTGRFTAIDTRLWRTRFGAPLALRPSDGGNTAAKPWPALPRLPKMTQPLPAFMRPDPALLPVVDGSPVSSRGTPTRDDGTDGYAIQDIDLMKIRQRINDQDLHYLDHPRLGLLVKVTPYQPDQPEQDEANVEPPAMINPMDGLLEDSGPANRE